MFSGGGDVAGVIYKQGLNTEEFIAALKRAFPKDDPRPEQLRIILEQFQTFHQTLFEWKELHNALDEIITSHGQFSAEVHRYEAINQIASLSTLRNLWYRVSIRIDTLLDFASNIHLIGKRYHEEDGKLTGEKWAVKMSEMRQQISIQIGLNEAYSFSLSAQRPVGLRVNIPLWPRRKPDWWVALCELNNEFDHMAHGQLHWTDKKLRETANELYTLSRSVFGRGQ